METPDTSVKIKFLIEMALQGEISWHALDPVINRLTPTLEKSRQIIKILLKEFESHQMICTKKTSKDDDDLPEDIAEMNKDQSNVNEVKMIQRSNSEEDEIEIIDKTQLPEEIMKIQDEEIRDEFGPGPGPAWPGPGLSKAIFLVWPTLGLGRIILAKARPSFWI